MGYSPRHILSYLGVPTVSMRKGPERRYRAGLVGRDALERLVFREEGDGLVNVGMAFDVPLQPKARSHNLCWVQSPTLPVRYNGRVSHAWLCRCFANERERARPRHLNMSVASDQVSGRRPNMTPICDDVERFGRDILG